jgi:hypothetical protein
MLIYLFFFLYGFGFDCIINFAMFFLLRKAYEFGRQSALEDDVEKILNYFKEPRSKVKTSGVTF